jgi:DNA-binding response OmpR family regulator
MPSKRILFVDDEPGWRFIVKDCLRDAGFEVVTAENATQAMVETDGLKLDLIILDLNLGGENGFVLMKFLKVNYPEVPFLLYTGLQQVEVMARTMPSDDDQPYLRKGPMGELLAGVEKALWREQTTASQALDTAETADAHVFTSMRDQTPLLTPAFR